MQEISEELKENQRNIVRNRKGFLILKHCDTSADMI